MFILCLYLWQIAVSARTQQLHSHVSRSNERGQIVDICVSCQVQRLFSGRYTRASPLCFLPSQCVRQVGVDPVHVLQGHLAGVRATGVPNLLSVVRTDDLPTGQTPAELMACTRTAITHCGRLRRV